MSLSNLLGLLHSVRFRIKQTQTDISVGVELDVISAACDEIVLKLGHLFHVEVHEVYFGLLEFFAYTCDVFALKSNCSKVQNEAKAVDVGRWETPDNIHNDRFHLHLSL